MQKKGYRSNPLDQVHPAGAGSYRGYMPLGMPPALMNQAVGNHLLQESDPGQRIASASGNGYRRHGDGQVKTV